MKKVMAGLRMIGGCMFIALYLIVLGIPILSYCRIASDPRLGLYFSRILARMVLFLTGIRVNVEGAERVRNVRGCVYVGNHRSFSDVVVVFYYLPGNLRFLIKKEVFKIPLVSFALRTMGMIPVDRSNREEAVKSVDLAIPEIQAGRSIVLFPEGTRSRAQEMLPFKKGAFVLAIKAGVPVVPFVLVGADAVLKPGTIQLYPGTIRLILHEPIDTHGYTMEDRDELTARARMVIETTYDNERLSV